MNSSPTALVADRREVLEVVTPAFRGDADFVSFLADDAEMIEEFRDPLRLSVLEFTVGVRRSNGRQNLRPWRGPALIQGTAHDLMAQYVQGESMYMERLEVLVHGRLDRSHRLHRVVRGYRKDQPTGCAVQRVARTPDPLDEGGDLSRGIVLQNLVDRPDVDS